MTDASTYGMGGVLVEGDRPREFFSIPIPGEFILIGSMPKRETHATWPCGSP